MCRKRTLKKKNSLLTFCQIAKYLQYRTYFITIRYNLCSLSLESINISTTVYCISRVLSLQTKIKVTTMSIFQDEIQ